MAELEHPRRVLLAPSSREPFSNGFKGPRQPKPSLASSSPSICPPISNATTSTTQALSDRGIGGFHRQASSILDGPHGASNVLPGLLLRAFDRSPEALGLIGSVVFRVHHLLAASSPTIRHVYVEGREREEKGAYYIETGNGV